MLLDKHQIMFLIKKVQIFVNERKAILALKCNDSYKFANKQFQQYFKGIY